MILWDYVYPDHKPAPDCPCVEFFKMRNEYLLISVCVVSSVAYFTALLAILKGRVTWPVVEVVDTAVCTAPVPDFLSGTDVDGHALVDNRRLKRILSNVLNKAKKNRPRGNGARSRERTRYNNEREERERCLLTEKMHREVRYEEVIAQKENLKQKLMDTEQRCFGLMMEAQSRYLEWLDMQDEIKQVDIRMKLLRDRLTFMLDK
ncbi:hypothetical protein NP493_16g07062 [Ridgeia piscesae]|uniref:Uncharacterized protein n=1 Tax=Ridgeia piscesae TaxID=27915 RepID=A0AAD9UL14_RIDPI|nr:hypothetical protein NP493_16g07062 [Ridgeia piscesae]